jgi:hypothetical protein
LCFKFSPVNSALRERQSSAANDLARSAVNAPLSSPACIGL